MIFIAEGDAATEPRHTGTLTRRGCTGGAGHEKTLPGVVVAGVHIIIYRSEGGTAAGTSTPATAGTTAPTISVAVLGLLALLEGVEAIGEGHHAVTAQGVVADVLDVVAGDVAVDVLALTQDVIDRDGDGGLLVAQELIGQRGVPDPLVAIVTAGVTTGGAVTQVGADDQAEGGRVGAVEHAAPGVDVACIGLECRRGGVLETVTGTQLNVKDTIAECQARRIVDHPGVAAVLDTVGDTLGDTIAGEQVAGEIPHLAGTEGEAQHVHRHGAPDAADVGIAGVTATGLLIGGDGRDDAVLGKIDVGHGHDAALSALGEVAEADVDVVVEGGLQLGVTRDDVERVALVGNRLQLGDAGLLGAHAVAEVEVAGIGELVAEAGIGGYRPSPAGSDVAGAVDEVAALGHGAVDTDAHVEVVGLAHLAEADAELLVEERVAEAVAQRLVPVLIGHGAAGPDALAHVVIDHLVAGSVAVVATIGELEEAGVLDVADGLGPGEASRDAVGLAAVVGRLVDELDAVLEVVGVVGIGVGILAHVTIGVVEHQGLAAAGMAGDLVVIDEACAPLIALAIVHEVTQAAVDARQSCITGTGERGVATLALVEVEREVGAEVDGVVAVHLPLDAEVTTQVVPLVTGGGVGIVVADRVGQQVLAGGAGAGVAVAVAVHEVATHAEVVILLAADVEIDAGILGRGHATITAEALEAPGSAVAKSQVVGIVATTQDGELIAVAEVVDHQVAGVALVGAIARIDGAKPAVVHALLDGEVDDGLVIAIVHASEACQVALAVDDLELVDHVGWDILAGHGGIVAEELLAVDEDLFHFLAIGGDLAIGAHLDARQALEQVLDHGIGLGLIGVGIELDGILLDRDGALDAHNDGLLEHDGVRIHLDHADVDIPAILADGDVLDHVVVAQIGEAQQVLAGLDALDIENTVEVGGSPLDKRAVLTGLEQSHRRLDELGRVLGVHKHAVDDGGT